MFPGLWSGFSKKRKKKKKKKKKKKDNVCMKQDKHKIIS